MINRVLACFLALLLASCLDTHEEIWLNADSSGAARIQVAMPLNATLLQGGEEGVRKMIKEYLGSAPEFTSHTLETSSADGRLHIDATVTFASAMDLADLTTSPSFEKLPSATARMAGTSTVDFHGLNVSFSRRVELSKAIPGAPFFPKNELKGHSLTTIIHLPKAATTHNATSTANGNRTLIWTTPLGTAFKRPVETSFTMPLPIPWLTLGVTALLVLLLAATLIYYVIRRRSKQTAG